MNEIETKIAKFEEIYLKEDENIVDITATLLSQTETHYIANVIQTSNNGDELHIDEGQYPKNLVDSI